MRPLSLLGVLAALGIAIWTVPTALALPGALAVSTGVSLTLGLVLVGLAIIVAGGVVATDQTATTYW